MLKMVCVEKNLPITLSIGIAVASQKSNFNTLFGLADQNLYKVKNGGRDGYLIAYDE